MIGASGGWRVSGAMRSSIIERKQARKNLIRFLNNGMKKNKKGYSERRLWYFICSSCGHRAQSHKRFKAINGECLNCRKFKIPENQPGLFEKENESICTDKSNEHQRRLPGEEVQDARMQRVRRVLMDAASGA